MYQVNYLCQEMRTLIVSMTDVDHLRLIGHVSSVEEAALRAALAIWPHGIKKSEYRNEIPFKDDTRRVYFVDFCGSPWGSYSKNERLHARQ